MSHSRYTTKNARTGRRGAFNDGIWHCDCEPRLPADKFQTKNGGKNHGRWFYTCQNPQVKRCKFFLWADEAKVREEGAVLSGRRNEPGIPVGAGGGREPQTPRKNAGGSGSATTTSPRYPQLPPTPNTSLSRAGGWKVGENEASTPTKRYGGAGESGDDNFDWSSSADEELVDVVSRFETPSRKPRQGADEWSVSPNKRTHDDMLAGQARGGSGLKTAAARVSPPGWETRIHDDIFTTPGTSHRPSNLTSTLVSISSPTTSDPSVTPTTFPTPATPSRLTAISTDPGSLVQSILHLLTSPHHITPSKQSSTSTSTHRPLSLPPEIRTPLIQILNTHDLRSQGYLKARDTARVAIESRNRRIAELEARVRQVESEREGLRVLLGEHQHQMSGERRVGMERGERSARRAAGESRPRQLTLAGFGLRRGRLGEEEQNDGGGGGGEDARADGDEKEGGTESEDDEITDLDFHRERSQTAARAHGDTAKMSQEKKRKKKEKMMMMMNRGHGDVGSETETGEDGDDDDDEKIWTGVRSSSRSKV